MDKNSKILIVGHNDIIDKSLSDYFISQGFPFVYASAVIGLNVFDQKEVWDFFEAKRPEYVFLSSIRSGGIAANQKYPAEFIYSNLECQNNVIHTAYRYGIKKLLFLSGSCSYPKECPQPIKEESLLTGPLEVTSEAYSVAKIAGMKMCQAYKKQYGFNAIVGIPATVYGPGVVVEPENAHVIMALITRFADAVRKGDKELVVWGSGNPRREFLYRDDFVNACLFLMDHYEGEDFINMGCGEDVSIKELVQILKEVSGFKGKIIFDRSKPDGTMKKLMDNRRISRLGWKAQVKLEEGVRKTYGGYIS